MCLWESSLRLIRHRHHYPRLTRDRWALDYSLNFKAPQSSSGDVRWVVDESSHVAVAAANRVGPIDSAALARLMVGETRQIRQDTDGEHKFGDSAVFGSINDHRGRFRTIIAHENKGFAHPENRPFPCREG